MKCICFHSMYLCVQGSEKHINGVSYPLSKKQPLGQSLTKVGDLLYVHFQLRPMKELKGVAPVGGSNWSPRITKYLCITLWGSGVFFQLLFLGPKLTKSHIYSSFPTFGPESKTGQISKSHIFGVVGWFPTYVPEPKSGEMSKSHIFSGRGRVDDRPTFVPQFKTG